MSSQIVLYSGPGASPFCVDVLESKMQSLCDDRLYRISKVSSFLGHYLDPGKPVKALFVPGGNAAEMAVHSDLSMKVNFIRGGGVHCECPQMKRLESELKYGEISYGGVCAGGILACGSFYEKGLGDDNLRAEYHGKGAAYGSFFPAGVLAPLFPKPPAGQPFSLANIHFDPVVLPQIEGSNRSLPSFHVLSPGFIDFPKEAEVLAKYGDTQPEEYKLIQASFPLVRSVSRDLEVASSLYYRGEFPMLITGPHFEVDSRDVLSERFRHEVSGSLEEREVLASAMEPTDEDRREVLRSFLVKLGIVCKKS